MSDQVLIGRVALTLLEKFGGELESWVPIARAAIASCENAIRESERAVCRSEIERSGMLPSTYKHWAVDALRGRAWGSAGDTTLATTTRRLSSPKDNEEWLP